MSKKNRENGRDVKESDYEQRSMAAVPPDIFAKAFQDISSKLQTVPNDTDPQEQLIRLHRHTRQFCERHGLDLQQYVPPITYRFLALLHTIDSLKHRLDFQRFLIHDRSGNIVGCDKASIGLAAEFPITPSDELTFAPDLFASKLQELCS
jgi:hypothetical protein